MKEYDKIKNCNVSFFPKKKIYIMQQLILIVINEKNFNAICLKPLLTKYFNNS